MITMLDHMIKMLNHMIIIMLDHIIIITTMLDYIVRSHDQNVESNDHKCWITGSNIPAGSHDRNVGGECLIGSRDNNLQYMLIHVGSQNHNIIVPVGSQIPDEGSRDPIQMLSSRHEQK